jgi:hypothetical protein
MDPVQVMRLSKSKKPYVGFSDNTSKQAKGALTQMRMSLTEVINACLCVRMISSSARTLPAAYTDEGQLLLFLRESLGRRGVVYEWRN